MMDWLVGVKPAVMKPEMEIHSPWEECAHRFHTCNEAEQHEQDRCYTDHRQRDLTDQARGGDDIGNHMLAATFRRIQP